MTTSDPTRSPPGTESMWAYTHVPQGQSLNAGSDALTGTWTQAEMSASLIAWNNELNAMRPGFVNESSSDTSWARGNSNQETPTWWAVTLTAAPLNYTSN